MEISSANSAQTAQAPQSVAQDETLGKDDFLMLFVAQLKAQNPLNPMDSADFTSQLAQFSSLEQLSNISSGVSNMVLFQGSLQNTLTAGLIGKQVKIAGADAFQTVTGVRFEDGVTTLILEDGTQIQLSQIAEIQGGV